MTRNDKKLLAEAYDQVLNNVNTILSEGILTPSQIKTLKSQGATTAQIKTLAKAIESGYELSSIVGKTGSLLIRNYEDANFFNVVYDKDLGQNDKCAIIDPLGRMSKISLKKFNELEDDL